MLYAFARSFAVLGCLATLAIALPAQEVVHALTGTVGVIDNAGRTMTVMEDGGSPVLFNVLSNPKTHMVFDKKVEASCTEAGAFKTKGAYVIVFYFGDVANPTVAALKNLGPGPFASTTGKVTHYESSEHAISVEDSSGKVQTFKVGAESVAETDYGVEEGLKFHPQTGDQVRVVSAMIDGNATALFLRAI